MAFWFILDIIKKNKLEALFIIHDYHFEFNVYVLKMRIECFYQAHIPNYCLISNTSVRKFNKNTIGTPSSLKISNNTTYFR